jgi:hypothetical protein
VQWLWRTLWRSLKKLKTELPCNPVISLLSIYLKEYATGYNRVTCTPMFIAALFTITKLWKQHRCPTTDEWINKIVVYIYIYIYIYIYMFIYTMEFYSAIKKNEIILFAGKWMELENFM